MKEFIQNSIDFFAEMGLSGLGLLAFAESSFFPVPPDLLLIAMSLSTPEKALLFAFVCTIFSTLGGSLGYGIGKFGGRPLFHKVFKNKEHYLEKVENMYLKYGLWAVFIAAFSPIPYKVFTIASGIFAFNFPRFLAASFVGRGSRFFIVSISLMLFGEMIKNYLELIIIAAVVVILLVLGVYYWRKNNCLTSIS